MCITNDIKTSSLKDSIFAILIAITVLSCDSDKIEKTYIVDTFDKEIVDTLVGKTEGTYTTQLIKVKGYANDSVYVSLGKNGLKQFYTGDIDTVFLGDYYGDNKVIFVFNPYKAKEGKLSVKFGIQ